MSDIAEKSPTFFSLYGEGQVTAEQADDFVAAWHASGDEETRSLPEYLGMSDEEYDVWLITRRALPAILAARRTNRPLPQVVSRLFNDLQAAGAPRDASVLYAMRHWLESHPAA